MYYLNFKFKNTPFGALSIRLSWRLPTLPHFVQYHWRFVGLTSLFGMGRGISNFVGVPPTAIATFGFIFHH